MKERRNQKIEDEWVKSELEALSKGITENPDDTLQTYMNDKQEITRAQSQSQEADSSEVNEEEIAETVEQVESSTANEEEDEPEEEQQEEDSESEE